MQANNVNPIPDTREGYCPCGCGNPNAGYLRGHQNRKVKYYVDKDSGCWIWTANLNSGGYGQLSFKGRRAQSAHRVMYEQLRGPIPEGLDLDHICRRRNCVNPDHLRPVTRAENIRAGIKPRLDPNSVREIRRAHQAGVTGRAIARDIGVSSTTVRSIIHYRTWKDISA
jgi:hypothetical protein